MNSRETSQCLDEVPCAPPDCTSRTGAGLRNPLSLHGLRPDSGDICPSPGPPPGPLQWLLCTPCCLYPSTLCSRTSSQLLWREHIRHPHSSPPCSGLLPF